MIWDMIERMLSDRLWIYTAIAGSIIGAMVVTYLGTSRIGLWAYAQFDKFVDYLVTKWGITWLQQPDDAWRKSYPKMTTKIDELEARIKTLENR